MNLLLDIEELTGISTDMFVLGLAALVVVLLVITIVNAVKTAKLKRRYERFMEGKDAASLENTLVKRLQQVDQLIENDYRTRRQVKQVASRMDQTFQKVGVVKYDAFDEMGGKLSFSLALLNLKNNGFIINAMHSREGCYTYIKEIINGNSIILLSEEEQEALDMALNSPETDGES